MFIEGNIDVDKKLSTEIALVKKFQREAHHYKMEGIDFLNIPEWLVLLQHYGHQQDFWTRCIRYGGDFFFIIHLQEANHSALWMINWKKIDDLANQTVKEKFIADYNLMIIEDFNDVVSSGNGVIKLNSFKQNQRQIIQQGTFLFPLNIKKSFEENLSGVAGKDVLIKIEIPYTVKSEVIQVLYRMNFHTPHCFPELVDLVNL